MQYQILSQQNQVIVQMHPEQEHTLPLYNCLSLYLVKTYPK